MKCSKCSYIVWIRITELLTSRVYANRKHNATAQWYSTTILALWEWQFNACELRYVVHGLPKEDDLHSHVLVQHISIVFYVCVMWCSLFLWSYKEHSFPSLLSSGLCCLGSAGLYCNCLHWHSSWVLPCVRGWTWGQWQDDDDYETACAENYSRVFSSSSVQPTILLVFLLEREIVLSLFLCNQTERCYNWT